MYDIYIYFGLGSYRLTIIDRNGGVGCKGDIRVVEKSSSCIANMNSEGLSDCESNLLEGVDRWCWGGVGVSIESPCLCEFPIMVGEFEDAFWAWEVCDLVIHRSGVGFDYLLPCSCCACMAQHGSKTLSLLDVKRPPNLGRSKKRKSSGLVDSSKELLGYQLDHKPA